MWSVEFIQKCDLCGKIFATEYCLKVHSMWAHELGIIQTNSVKVNHTYYRPGENNKLDFFELEA